MDSRDNCVSIALAENSTAAPDLKDSKERRQTAIGVVNTANAIAGRADDPLNSPDPPLNNISRNGGTISTGRRVLIRDLASRFGSRALSRSIRSV